MNVRIAGGQMFRDLPKGAPFIYESAVTLRVKIDQERAINLGDGVIYKIDSEASIIPVEIDSVIVKRIP